MGMVELSGLAIGPHTVVAPVTQRFLLLLPHPGLEWKRQDRSSQWFKSPPSACIFLLSRRQYRTGFDRPARRRTRSPCDFQQEFCDSFFTTKKSAAECSAAPVAPRHQHHQQNQSPKSTASSQERAVRGGTLGENPASNSLHSPFKTKKQFRLAARSLHFRCGLLACRRNRGQQLSSVVY